MWDRKDVGQDGFVTRAELVLGLYVFELWFISVEKGYQCKCDQLNTGWIPIKFQDFNLACFEASKELFAHFKKANEIFIEKYIAYQRSFSETFRK